MKRLLRMVLIAALAFIVASAAWYIIKMKAYASPAPHAPRATLADNKKLLRKMADHSVMARRFARENGFNTSTCFFVDMSIESGKNRFFVYNLQNDSVCYNGLVTHGCCNQSWLTGRRYGNEPGCGCTSLGKYKIGNPYHGKFGLAYKLYGLDATNSNAFKRFVVLHSMQCVPELEVHPYPICQSDGCPTVSPGLLKQLAGIIDNSKKPILLWIYE